MALRVRISRGEDPAGEKSSLREQATFGELALDYLERYAKPHRRSWREDQRRLDASILPRIGKTYAGLAIEDHSLIALQSGGRTCLVETGYLYPAPVGVFDIHFSVRTEAHYFTASEPGNVEISSLDGERRSLSATTTNMPHYPTFVSDTLARLRGGRPPIAGLNDMAPVMALLDEAAQQSIAASNAHPRAKQPPIFAIS